VFIESGDWLGSRYEEEGDMCAYVCSVGHEFVALTPPESWNGEEVTYGAE
jgi:hypothetical protein